MTLVNITKMFRAKNLALRHNIPVGALVEVNGGTSDMLQTGLRLYVCDHTRDCDGTPLYSLTHDSELIFDYKKKLKEAEDEPMLQMRSYMVGAIQGAVSKGWAEDDMTVIGLRKPV